MENYAVLLRPSSKMAQIKNHYTDVYLTEQHKTIL